MRDIMAMDEAVPSFRQCVDRLCCFFQHSKTAEVLQLESVEKGALLADEVRTKIIFLVLIIEKKKQKNVILFISDVPVINKVKARRFRKVRYEQN